MANKTQGSIYGEIPSHWSITTLKNVCIQPGGVQTGPFGSQLHQRDYQPFGTPIITVEHLGENRIIHQSLPYVSKADCERLSRYTLRSGDIVFSRVGSVDRRSLVREAENGWLFSGRCLRVRPNSNHVDSGYLSWFFGLPNFKEYIRRIAVGATMPSLNTDLLSNVEVILPPLEEQKAIAHILGTLDDKIDLNQQMNRNLEAIASAIFKSWFVDFDPVRAKVEGRHPVGMDAATAALFPDSFEDSQLGEIPKGWRVGELGEIAHIVMGQSPPGETYNELGDGLPFYQGVRDFRFRFPYRRIYCTVPKRFAQKGDVLFSVRAPVGDLNIAVENCAIGRGIAALRLKPKHGSFLYYFLKATQLEWEKFEAEGTVFGSVSKNDIHRFKLIVPTSEIIEKFNDLTNSTDARIESNEQESLTLATIRDTLLPKLMSGEIRVKEAEKIVEDAA